MKRPKIGGMLLGGVRKLDPDAIARGPAWLASLRIDLGHLVASVGGHGPTVESVLTCFSICASCEVELPGLADPLVIDSPSGHLSVKFHGPHGSILLDVMGRKATPSAWYSLSPASHAFDVRDSRGEVVGDPPASVVAQMRLGLYWCVGEMGPTELEVRRAAWAGGLEI
jgi:hypothetical protein